MSTVSIESLMPFEHGIEHVLPRAAQVARAMLPGDGAPDDQRDLRLGPQPTTQPNMTTRKRPERQHAMAKLHLFHCFLSRFHREILPVARAVLPRQIACRPPHCRRRRGRRVRNSACRSLPSTGCSWVFAASATAAPSRLGAEVGQIRRMSAAVPAHPAKRAPGMVHDLYRRPPRRGCLAGSA